MSILPTRRCSRMPLSLKGWQTAIVRMTKTFKDKDPENVTFRDVKLTSSVSFRKLFPGRPLISADSAGSRYGTVSVDQLALSIVNDTHMYRDTRDPSGSQDPRNEPVCSCHSMVCFGTLRALSDLVCSQTPLILFFTARTFRRSAFRYRPFRRKNCSSWRLVVYRLRQQF